MNVRALPFLVVLIVAACEQPSPPADRATDEPALAPPPPAPPAPPPNITGSRLTFVDRQGDTTLRHGQIMAVGISTSGRTAASGAQDGSVAVWDTATGRSLAWIKTPHGNVYAVAVTDDARLLATTGWDDTVRVWDVATGRQLWEAKSHGDRLRFNAAGTRLFARRYDLFRVWSAADGRSTWTDVNKDPYNHESIKPDRAHALASDGTIAIALEATGHHTVQHGCVSSSIPTGFVAAVHDVGTGAALHRFAAGDVDTRVIGTSPKADRVVAMSGSHLRVFARDGARFATVRIGADHAQLAHQSNVLLTDDPKYAITWDLNEVAAWDVLAQRELWRGKGGVFRDPQLAGPETVITAQAGACIARRISDGKQLWRRDGCMYVAALPTSSTVFMAIGVSRLDVVDAQTGRSKLALPRTAGPLSPIDELAVSPDGKRVIGFARDPALWRWDASGAHQLVMPPQSLWRPVLHFLPSGRLIAVDDNRGIRILRYDVERDTIEASRDIQLPLRLGGGRVFSGDSLIVEEVREHDYVRTMFDLEDRAPPRKLAMWKRPADRPHLVLRNESLYSAVADPTTQRMYVTGEDNHIHAWDLRTGRLVARYRESNGFIRDLVLTPDRKHLIVPRDKGPIVVLSPSTLKEIYRFVGPTEYVTMAAASPDSTLVAVAAYDGLYVWNLVDGTRVAKVDFSPNHEAPNAIAFSPDGTTLWVGTTTGNLLRFRVAP